MAWNQDRDDTLRGFWVQKISTEEIGRMMGTTKGSVIGRAHRIGLPCRRMSSKAMAAQARQINAARLAKLPKKQPTKKPANPVRVILKQEPPAMPTEADLTPLVAGVSDLEGHHCRWIPGEPSGGFCGRQKVEGTPYCEFHVRKAYVLARPAKPPYVHRPVEVGPVALKSVLQAA